MAARLPHVSHMCATERLIYEGSLIGAEPFRHHSHGCIPRPRSHGRREGSRHTCVERDLCPQRDLEPDTTNTTEAERCRHFGASNESYAGTVSPVSCVRSIRLEVLARISEILSGQISCVPCRPAETLAQMFRFVDGRMLDLEGFAHHITHAGPAASGP